MRIGIIIAALLLSFVLVEDTDAIGRRRRRSRNYYSYNSGGYSNTSWGSTPAEVADAKARYLASRNAMFHPGGGYSSANAEGVGAGMSPAQALGNCCFTGQRSLAASACYQGSNGMWYAVKLFW